MKTIPATLLALAALSCTSTSANARHRQQPAPAAPYSVELVGASGEVLDTYSSRGRLYVHGHSGQRYSIRVHNPTNQRIEAVLSVDGLDVIDGKSANFRTKRGYIVQPYGDLLVDGFRVSTQSVAAFRFSSVAQSYAGRKGQARNVGVIGVAIFAERQRPVIAYPQPRPYPRPHPHHHRNRSGAGAADNGTSVTEEAESAPAPARSAKKSAAHDSSPPRERRGLGTKFGEQRHSAIYYTKFRRANKNVPTVVATLRYNNARGLRALGIRLYPDRTSETALRESANPFPNSPFAQPPAN